MRREFAAVMIFIFVLTLSLDSMAFDFWPRPEVYSLSTNKGVNNELIDLTIKGDQFAKSVVVKLTRYDQPENVATNVRVISKNEIACTLDLKGKPPGVWDITIINMNHFMFFSHPKLVILLKRFTIEFPPPAATVIKPDQAINNGKTTICITGNDFRPGAGVMLIYLGKEIKATHVDLNSDKQITAEFNLNGIETGSYDVSVTNTDNKSSVLSGALLITNRRNNR